MSFQDDQNDECPLCMEPFEMDDFNFYPCICGYQICRFCWHRIRTDENGLCPACRKQYTEDPADFKPLTTEEWQKIKNEKRQKVQQKKQKLSENRNHLANVRVVQKNLVFVVGLPTRLADAEVLKKHDYFGKFGKIHKVVVNQSTAYAGSQGPSASAYVTYCKPEDALRAIKSVNNIQVDGRTLKASLGTTKYCSHFLKNQQCPKTDCMYLHELGDEAASFTKEDMQQGKHQEYEKKLQDQIVGCNNRKQTASPTPAQNNNTSSGKDTWPSTQKESRTSRSKDSSQNQRTEGKSSRSKAKHTEGQKSKKSKNKTSDSAQHSKNSSKDDCTSTKKSQKAKHKDPASSAQAPVQPVVQRLETTDSELSPQGSLSDVCEMTTTQQTTYVHITEQRTPPKAISASIEIARGESPTLPASPISSSSSSLFTPFGSLSSNFMSSSSPSPPPPNNANPLSFGGPGVSGFSQEEGGSPVNAFGVAPPSQLAEHKRQSPPFSLVESGESLFSHHLNYRNPVDSGSFSSHLFSDETCTQDNSEWSSNYSYEEPQKPEDDLDFDPWNESSKGLADLIAKEANHNRNCMNEMPTPPGFFQPIKPPVPNQQRISIPPPGFCRPVPQPNSLNHLSNMFSPNTNTEFLQNCNKIPSARQTLNGCSQFFLQQEQQQQQQQQHQQISVDLANQFKQHYSQLNSSDSLIENIRKKVFEERVRNLIPDMYYHLNSRNIPKNQIQNGPSWNHPGRDISWLANESALNISENQTSNAIWMKALQSLSLEDNSSRFNGHTAYPNAFPLRGQWPTAQCPPPGFVAPSRSTVNTPFQHMQVNQKI